MSLSTIRRAFSLTHSLILPRSYSLSRNIRSEAIWIPTRVTSGVASGMLAASRKRDSGWQPLNITTHTP